MEEEEKECPICKGTGEYQWEDEIESCYFCNGFGVISKKEAEENMEEERGERMSDLQRENNQ